MPKAQLISFACNHPDNGNFCGRADFIHYADSDLELYGNCSVRYLDDGRIRISRKVFTYLRLKEWFGNWCWDAVWMQRAEARRLLRYLKDSKTWHAEAGPCRLYEWFNDGKPTAPRCKHGFVKATCGLCRRGEEARQIYIAKLQSGWRPRKRPKIDPASTQPT